MNRLKFLAGTEDLGVYNIRQNKSLVPTGKTIKHSELGDTIAEMEIAISVVDIPILAALLGEGSLGRRCVEILAHEVAYSGNLNVPTQARYLRIGDISCEKEENRQVTTIKTVVYFH